MSLSPSRKQRVGKVNIGYLGSNCSFTGRAATRFFNQSEYHNISTIEYQSIHSSQAIFQKVSSGEVTYGVIPIESSSHGNLFSFFDIIFFITFLLFLIFFLAFLLSFFETYLFEIRNNFWSL